jgi:hypothetical protein
MALASAKTQFVARGFGANDSGIQWETGIKAGIGDAGCA